MNFSNWLENEEEREINPATGKPIMTMDDFTNIRISLMRHGAVEPSTGLYIYDSQEARQQALEEALKFYPELGYELKEKDGKFEIHLTGE